MDEVRANALEYAMARPSGWRTFPESWGPPPSGDFREAWIRSHILQDVELRAAGPVASDLMVRVANLRRQLEIRAKAANA